MWKSNAGDPVWRHVYSEPSRCGAAFCLAGLENGMFKGRVLFYGQLERCSGERQTVAQTDQSKSSAKAIGQHSYSSAKQRGRPEVLQLPAVNPACFEGHVWETR